VPVAGKFWLNIDFAGGRKMLPGRIFRIGRALGRNCRDQEIFADRIGKYFHFSSNGGCEKVQKTAEKSGSRRHTGW
jgi:hypothetical protein